MYTKVKKGLGCLLIVFIAGLCAGCGSPLSGDAQKETESESEQEIEILDAKDILTTVWSEYETIDTDGNVYNDRFEVMGGHFDSSLIGEPETYDLAKTTDLMQMYCVPEASMVELDDVATMIDLYDAARFTVSAVHATEPEKVSEIIDGIRTQVISNQWHSDKPEKLVIIQIKEQYIVSVFGETLFIDEFEEILTDIYRKAAKVVVEEMLPFN